MTGISTRTLSMIYTRLTGRKISPTEVSNASKDLIDAEEWILLRTTKNVIERLDKEFRRRTRLMEIVAGEDACYTLLAFIFLKMELYWRSNPIEKCITTCHSSKNWPMRNLHKKVDSTDTGI